MPLLTSRHMLVLLAVLAALASLTHVTLRAFNRRNDVVVVSSLRLPQAAAGLSEAARQERIRQRRANDVQARRARDGALSPGLPNLLDPFGLQQQGVFQKAHLRRHVTSSPAGAENWGRVREWWQTLQKQDEPTVVVVLGGSVAAGHQLELDSPPNRTWTSLECRRNQSWPAQLEQWLNYRFPVSSRGRRHRVVNLAAGGSGTMYAALQFHGNLAREAPTGSAEGAEHGAYRLLLSADLIICEFGVNDSMEPSKRTSIQRYTDLLLRQALALPRAPAVLYYEYDYYFWSPMRQGWRSRTGARGGESGDGGGGSGGGGSNGSTSSGTTIMFPNHRRVLDHYGVATLDLVSTFEECCAPSSTVKNWGCEKIEPKLLQTHNATSLRNPQCDRGRTWPMSRGHPTLAGHNLLANTLLLFITTALNVPGEELLLGAPRPVTASGPGITTTGSRHSYAQRTLPPPLFSWTTLLLPSLAPKIDSECGDNPKKGAAAKNCTGPAAVAPNAMISVNLRDATALDTRETPALDATSGLPVGWPAGKERRYLPRWAITEVQPPGSWSVYADDRRQKKFGTITNTTGAKLAMRLRPMSSVDSAVAAAAAAAGSSQPGPSTTSWNYTVIAGLMRSYENFGRVRMELYSEDDRGTATQALSAVVDGWWVDRSSQYDDFAATVSLPRPASSLLVSFQLLAPDGRPTRGKNKFKLFDVMLFASGAGR